MLLVAENLVEVGFLFVVCFLYKTDRKPRKIVCCGKKRGPTATFLTFHFSWVGLACGLGSFRRFHNSIYMFSNPTAFGKSHNSLLKAFEHTCVLFLKYRYNAWFSFAFGVIYVVGVRLRGSGA